MTAESFEPWEAFVARAAIGVHRVDRDGYIRWASARELRDLGYQPEDYVGRHVSEVHLDQPVAAKILTLLDSGEELRAHPARLIHRSGATVYVLITSNVYRSQDGEFVHTRCFTQVVSRPVYEALRALLDEDPCRPKSSSLR